MHLFVAVFANGAWIKFVDLIFCNTNVFFLSKLQLKMLLRHYRTKFHISFWFIALEMASAACNPVVGIIKISFL